MKAGVFLGPGVAEVQEWPEPTVGPGQVKVKIAYAGICGSDVESLNHRMGFQRAGLNFNGTAPGRTGAVVEGHEATGTIVEVGPGLKGDWRVGQRVVLSVKGPCGVCYYCRTKRARFCQHISWATGAFAEYAVFPEGGLFGLPDDVDFRVAALVEPLTVALDAVACTGIRNGQTLAISGGGAIGLLCLAVTLGAGAGKVLVSEPVACKREVAMHMGADMVVDPLTDDLADAGSRLTEGRGFDAVIEASGHLRAAEQALELAGRGGTIVWTGMYPCDTLVSVKPFHLYLKELTIRSAVVLPYAFLPSLQLLPSLKVERLVTDVYPLDEFAAAFRNHERGKSIKTLIKM